MKSKKYPLAEGQVNLNPKPMHGEDFLGFFNFKVEHFNFKVGQKLRVCGYLKQSQPILGGV